jgi:tryptophan 2,3-dioxygenase
MKSLTYTDYLKLDVLLNLQKVKSDPPEHDETLFIIIHQVYELWFKLLLHEMDKIKMNFSKNDLYGALATFKRLRTVMKTLVGQLDILETMTPTSFSGFRDRLEAASGFQSFQFRELEFVLGHKRPEMMEYHRNHSVALAALQRRLSESSVVDCFYRFLEQRGLAVPAELKNRPAHLPTIPSDGLQELLIELYRRNPESTMLLELMTDFDEGFQEWRYRHVKMVERTIGFKQGTGGSSGVDFLRQTLFKPVFADLWAIRDRL